jgi:transmembrane sensor
MMTKFDDPRSDVQAQAEEWLLHLRSGKVTQQDLEAFRLWCADHPQMAHDLRKTWTHLRTASARVAQREAATGVSKGRNAGRENALRPGRRAFVGFAVMAGASWLAIRPPFQLWPAIGELTADYRTGTGEQKRIALAEDVTVNMNTQTRIDVLPVSARQGASRGINLLAGEAEVIARATTSAQDFVVVAGSGRLQAQRAQFDVRRTVDQVCVTCISGSLSLVHPQRSLMLSAGEQLVYDDHNVHRVASVDSSIVTAWRRGVLVFNGVPLAQVIDEINRYRPGKVILRNASLGTASVEAQSPITRLDILIDTLSKAYGAHVTKLPGDIVLLT